MNEKFLIPYLTSVGGIVLLKMLPKLSPMLTTLIEHGIACKM